MTLQTFADKLALMAATNLSDSSFTLLVPTITAPSGVGVVTIAQSVNPMTANQIVIYPFGVGSDASTFNLRLSGWKSIGDSSHTTLYVPFIICELVVTLGTTPGVANTLVGASQSFADTVALTYGNNNVDIVLSNGPTNGLAYCLVDIKGCGLVQIQCDMVDATSGNALFSQL